MDDKIRDYGVNISLRRASESGRLELVLDDTIRQNRVESELWEHWAFFTSIDLEVRDLRDIDLSEERLAGIGKALLARLSARASRGRMDEGS